MRGIIWSLFLVLMVVTGCDGNSGSSPATAAASGPIVSGAAAKGRFVSGFAQAFEIDLSRANAARPRGAPLSGRTPLLVSSTDSRFVLSLRPGYSGPLLVEVDGTYLDEVRGITATIPVSTPLRGAGFTGRTTGLINVTALNHIACAEATRLAGEDISALRAALAEANARTAGSFGLRPADLESLDVTRVTSRALRAIASAGLRRAGGPDSAFRIVSRLAEGAGGSGPQATPSAPVVNTGDVFTDVGRELADDLPGFLRVSFSQVQPQLAGRGGSVNVQVRLTNVGGTPVTLTGASFFASPPNLTFDGGGDFPPRVIREGGFFATVRTTATVAADAVTGPVTIGIRYTATTTEGDVSGEESAVASLDVVGAPERNLPHVAVSAARIDTTSASAGGTLPVTLTIANEGSRSVTIRSLTAAVTGPFSTLSEELPARLEASVTILPQETAEVPASIAIPRSTGGGHFLQLTLSVQAADSGSGVEVTAFAPPALIDIAPLPAVLSIAGFRLSTTSVSSPGDVTLEVDLVNSGGGQIAFPFVTVAFDSFAGFGGVSNFIFELGNEPRIATVPLRIFSNVPPGPLHFSIAAIGQDSFFGLPVSATSPTSGTLTVLPSPPRAELFVNSVSSVARVAPGTSSVPIRVAVVNAGRAPASELQLTARAVASQDSRPLEVRPSPSNPASVTPGTSAVLELLLDVPADVTSGTVAVEPVLTFFDGVERRAVDFFDERVTLRVNTHLDDPPAVLSLSALRLSTDVVAEDGSFSATFDVTNSGGQPATDIAYLYDSEKLAAFLPVDPPTALETGATTTVVAFVQTASFGATGPATIGFSVSYDDGIGESRPQSARLTATVEVIPSESGDGGGSGGGDGPPVPSGAKPMQKRPKHFSAY